jgi:membrane-associated phospholipid phosphatase
MNAFGLVKRRLDPAQRYGLRLTLFAMAVVLLIGPFAFLVREVTTHGDLTGLDLSAARGLHGLVLSSRALVIVLEAISFVGSPVWFYFLLGGAAIYLWFKKRRRLAVFIAVTGLGGGAVDTIAKVLVARPRPSLPHPVATAPANSFPSGHTMVSTIGYGILLLVFLPLVPRRWRIPLVVAACLIVCVIGFSRLALGVHYITDVIGGFLLGLAWLAASTAAFSIWRTEEGMRPVDLLEGVDPEATRDLERPYNAPARAGGGGAARDGTARSDEERA